MSKQTKITKSARGEECQVRVPNVCKPAPENETTIPAHLNGGGMGMKHSDIHIAYCCDACHAWLDGGYVKDSVYGCDRDLIHLESVIRTQIILLEKDLIKTCG